MKIGEILNLLSAEPLVVNHDLDDEVPRGGAADLMSDVLAFGTDGMILMTGLINPQVVRTAEMAGIGIIVFVRGKNPPPETIELARESAMTLIMTEYTMYEACGILYKNGLPGLGRVRIENDTW
jgi:hypothetical protein